MKWLMSIAQLGIKYYLTKAEIEHQLENLTAETKARIPVVIAAVMSLSLLFAGFIAFILELGRQIESHEFIYFSGTLILVFTIVMISAVTTGVGYYLTHERLKKIPRPEAKRESPYRDPALFMAGEIVDHVASRMAAEQKIRHETQKILNTEAVAAADLEMEEVDEVKTPLPQKKSNSLAHRRSKKSVVKKSSHHH